MGDRMDLTSLSHIHMIPPEEQQGYIRQHFIKEQNGLSKFITENYRELQDRAVEYVFHQKATIANVIKDNRFKCAVDDHLHSCA